MTTKAELRALLDRPFAELRRSKDEAVAALDLAARFALADDLRRHAERLGAKNPTDAEADLEAAVALRRTLDRAEQRRTRPP